MQNSLKNRASQPVVQAPRTVIMEIPINQICLGNYQKALNKKRVTSIITTFNANRMRPIEVSLRDGVYWCWDGQHRLSAYRELNRPTIPCQVHIGLTYEDEARLFAEQQGNVGSITTAHKFNALKEANDPQTLRIIKKCQEYGFSVHPTRPGGKNIRSIKMLQTIEKDLGVNRLGDVVWLVKCAWNHSPDSTHENILGGIGLFMKRYLYREDNRKAYDTNSEIMERLRTSLSSVDARKLLQDASKFYGYNGNKRVALAAVELYNKNLRKGGKNRLARFDL